MANFLTRLFFGAAGGAPVLDAAHGGVQLGIVSPWADSSHLAHIAYSDLFGLESQAVGRDMAMTVAPFKRGRAIIVGAISDLPLVAGRFDGDEFAPLEQQPKWLSNTNTVRSCWHRMAWTLDDLIFHGWSLWALQRSEAGTILDAVRVHQSQWEFDTDAAIGIRVNGQEVLDPRSVLLFEGPDEGVLRTGATVIAGARAMEDAWVGRVTNPIPMTVLHEVERNGVSETEAQAYVNTWSAARRSPDGAVGFLPAQLNMEVYGDTNADLFTEGRNNVRLDAANLLNLPASLLDGSTATASLTYVTQEGERTSLVDLLEYWMAPIEARLSMPDVTPYGQVIRYSRGNLTDVPNDPYGPPALAPGDAEQPQLEAAAETQEAVTA